MTHHQIFSSDLTSIRKSLIQALELSDRIHELESELVHHLYKIDQQRTYVRIGYKSLRGFCTQGLKFGRTQSQRIVTRVRRNVPTVNIDA